MYLCECLYQARAVSNNVFVWVVVPSQNSERSCICVSGCIKSEQWAIMYVCGWLCQAKTVSDHLFVCVVVPSQNSERSCICVSGCAKPDQWVIMYLCERLQSQNSERSCIWVSGCTKPEQWAIMYLCEWLYQAITVSEHVFVCCRYRFCLFLWYFDCILKLFSHFRICLVFHFITNSI